MSSLLDAGVHGGDKTLARARLSLLVVMAGSACVVVWSAVGFGPLLALAEGPLWAVSLFVGAVLSCWRFTGAGVVHLSTTAGRALASLSDPWSIVLLCGFASLAARHDRGQPR